MSRQVLLELPEETFARLSSVAASGGRGIPDIIAEIVVADLPPVEEVNHVSRAVEALDDQHILALADLQPDQEWSDRFSELQSKQSEGVLTKPEQRELFVFLREYEIDLLRKATAMAQA
ncbi:MAG: hypothetical protein ACO1SX_28110 [Actinomycetota bacterium]